MIAGDKYMLMSLGVSQTSLLPMHAAMELYNHIAVKLDLHFLSKWSSFCFNNSYRIFDRSRLNFYPTYIISLSKASSFENVTKLHSVPSNLILAAESCSLTLLAGMPPYFHVTNLLSFIFVLSPVMRTLASLTARTVCTASDNEELGFRRCCSFMIVQFEECLIFIYYYRKTTQITLSTPVVIIQRRAFLQS
jgi:hypothetical protein